MQRWTCSEITRLAVTMGLLCCFATTMSETFSATPLEVLVSQPLSLRRRTKLLGRGQNQATSPSSSIIGDFRAVTTHTLQKKILEIATEEAGTVAQDAHDKKLLKSLEVCKKEGIHFVPLAWESTGGATDTVHATIRKWTDLEGARSGYAAHLIRRNLYAQISCCLQRHLAQSVIDRRVELACERAL